MVLKRLEELHNSQNVNLINNLQNKHEKDIRMDIFFYGIKPGIVIKEVIYTLEELKVY